jgi:hypothetical protein
MSFARRCFITAFAAVSIPAHTQSPPPQQALAKNTWTGTGLVAGQVTEAGTGRIVDGATVCMWMQPGPQEQSCVIADAKGRYVQSGVMAGTYRLAAEASGYILGGYGMQRPEGAADVLSVADGVRRTGIDLHVWKRSTISGTVVDEHGDAVVGALVQQLQRKPNLRFLGRSVLIGQTGGQTNDLGQFRFSTTPGDYALMVTPAIYSTSPARATQGPAMRVGDLRLQWQSPGRGSTATASPMPLVERSGAAYVYSAAFAPDLQGNTPAVFTLEPGQDRIGVTLTVRLTRAFSISGHVSGPDGPMAGVRVRLLPPFTDELSVDDGFEVAAATSDSAGAYTFLGVPAGSFLIRGLDKPASAAPAPAAIEGVAGQDITMAEPVNAVRPAASSGRTLAGNAAVVVADKDLTGVNVQLRRGGSVSGRFVFEGTATRPSSAAISRQGSGIVGVTGPAVGVYGMASMSGDGEFVTPEFPPGQYVAQPGVPFVGWTFKSATLGGRDVSEEPFELNGTDLTDLVLRFTDQISTLSGVVQNDRGRAGSEAVVIAVPADFALREGRPLLPFRRLNVKVKPDGTFTTNGLLPGDYLVAAVDEVQAGDWQQMDLMKAIFSGGAPVTIREGQRTTVALKVREVKR